MKNSAAAKTGIVDLLKEERAVITDGSMGTYLEKLGYSGITPEFASIKAPELVASVHADYIKAGASIIITNTFGANRRRLALKKLEGYMEAVNVKSSEIAVEAVSRHKGVLVAGDIGPSGDLLEPYGNLTKKEAEDMFLNQAAILKKSGADFILLETFQDLEEMKIAYNIIREKLDIFTLPSFALTPGGEYRTLMGQRIEDLLKWAEGAGILGVNCGLNSGQMKTVISRIRGLTEMPLWVKPNAGIPEVSDNKVIYPESEEEFVDNCSEMVKNQVKFIGGCCGTTPDYIQLLKKKIDENS